MGAIFFVTVPDTIMRSACLGLGLKTSAPKRAMSNRAIEAHIISMAQHARPKVTGQRELARARSRILSRTANFMIGSFVSR